MINTSLRLQNKISPKDLLLLTTVNSVAKELDIPYVVVDATARDLVLYHAFGAPIRRATTDIDFANQLIEEMCHETENEYVNRFNLLQAFANGFRNF